MISVSCCPIFRRLRPASRARCILKRRTSTRALLLCLRNILRPPRGCWRSPRGYAEARYSSDGKRWEPVLRPLELEMDECELPLTAHDVLVVTGGARGITAECALRLARESGARLAIFGLSQPTADDEIVSNRKNEGGGH